MTTMTLSAPPAPAIRNRKALVFLDGAGAGKASGGAAGRRLAHALTTEGYAVRTVESDAGDHSRVGAFLDGVEPGDLLLVRWSSDSGRGPGDFGALMTDFARRVERSDGAALLLIVDFGWLVSAGPGRPDETLTHLRVRGEPVAAAAALTTSAALPGKRPDRAVSLTAMLADGILSGEADLDRDGTISVADLYRYADERCAGLGADRRPYLLTYGEGESIAVACARGPGQALGPAFAAALARLADAGDTVAPCSAGDLAARVHDVHLDEDARRLLRRTSLLAEDEPLTDETAALLMEGGPAQAALAELASWGLLGEGAPVAVPAVRAALSARLDRREQARVSGVLRRWRAGRRAVRPRARLTGDRWTLKDRLGHRVHAEAIAAFVRHPETRPPLTIGVKGPWGAGKTSLMRMVQDLLDPGAAEDRPAEIHLAAAAPAGRPSLRERLAGRHARGASASGAGAVRGRVTNGEVLSRARKAEAGGAEYAVPGELPLRHADWRPTVWFNPWMYQSGEQVWAGLAHEIISQVTGRLPRGERERFWLALNLSRIDREEVRRRAYRMAATRLLPVALAFCATLLVTSASLAASALVPAAGALLRGTAAAVGSGGSLLVLAAACLRLARFLRESADTAFTRLVRQPDLLGDAPGLVAAAGPGYRSRTGFLHLVQTDMRRVLGMVATEERPLVVFVDDLDRCSPGTVAQVIEAVNLFLAGEFPNCVFVLAMEPEVVAAHVEAAYQDLARSLPDPAEERSGLGWRFLEKIVQLPLSVPVLDDDERLPAYLRALLGVPAAVPPGRNAMPAGASPATPAEADAAPRPAGDLPPRAARAPERPAPEVVDRLESAIRAMEPAADRLDIVAHEAQRALGVATGADDLGGLSAAARLAADRVYDDLYSDENAYAAIVRVLPALTLSNPRELKRYVNVFRFYSFVTYRRALAGAPKASDEQVAKLAVLTIRWPHLLSLLARVPGDVTGRRGGRAEATVLGLLERAAGRPGAQAWATALAEAGLIGEAGAETARWDPLRALLRADPPVTRLACELL
ncbi:hypothetical protein Sme01_00530 [Sphaerisporangium melleum]|uniref:KAP NTPase domain-containing protein n=1 Tax=Sphaerisporangium melleum TaxID=321316 RepID=A0A917VSE9_9ACTN|nr:P-loop NTPase fold protein [Sphaerisporangium melleum]GGL09565.1 hypothetical protein GCM10007964_59750 [Sphaerisporangium melleum]GII67577.1 hypothetical protein Sme01_00530 [Sphaerisporangium melleum]